MFFFGGVCFGFVFARLESFPYLMKLVSKSEVTAQKEAMQTFLPVAWELESCLNLGKFSPRRQGVHSHCFRMESEMIWNMFCAGETQGRVWNPLLGLKALASSLHVMSWYSTVLLSEVARSALLGYFVRSTCLYDCTRDEHCEKHRARPSRKWGSVLFLFFLQLCPICHIEILQVTHYLYEHQKHYLPYSFHIETLIVLTVWGQSHY